MTIAVIRPPKGQTEYGNAPAIVRVGENTAEAARQARLAEAAADEAAETLADVNTAGATHLAAVNAAGMTQVTAVNTAGATQLGAVNTAGAAQVTAVQTEGTAQIALATTQATNAANSANAAAISESSAAASALTAQLGAVDGTGDLEKAVDRNGRLYRRVDSAGEEYLPNLKRSVQSEILLRTSERAAAFPAGDIAQLTDRNGKIVSRTDKRGAHYLIGARTSVQHGLRRSLAAKPRYSTNPRLARHNYPASVTAAVQALHNQCLPFIEPPTCLVPNGYTLPDSVLTAFTLTDPAGGILMDFPYSLGGNVHPYLLETRQPLFGYRYLLLDSDHINGTSGEETPVMFGTNDLVNFDLIPSVPQPMVQTRWPGTATRAYDGFTSDPFFTYDLNDGALIWVSRDTQQEPVVNTELVMTKTYNGEDWTAPVRVNLPGTQGVAPCMLHDPASGTWHLWQSENEGTVQHYTASSWLGPWTFSSTTNFNALYGFNLWHFEVKRVGTRFALCGNSRNAGSQVRIAFSTNGDAWTLSPNLTPGANDIYKPTFLTDWKDENTVRFIFAWGHWNWVSGYDNDGKLTVRVTDWIAV